MSWWFDCFLTQFQSKVALEATVHGSDQWDKLHTEPRCASHVCTVHALLRCGGRGLQWLSHCNVLRPLQQWKIETWPRRTRVSPQPKPKELWGFQVYMYKGPRKKDRVLSHTWLSYVVKGCYICSPRKGSNSFKEYWRRV